VLAFGGYSPGSVFDSPDLSAAVARETEWRGYSDKILVLDLSKGYS
jgi:hypothetical protein